MMVYVTTLDMVLGLHLCPYGCFVDYLSFEEMEGSLFSFMLLLFLLLAHFASLICCGVILCQDFIGTNSTWHENEYWL